MKNLLYRLALRITMNREEAEDIVQDTLIKVWNKRDDWENIESIEAFSLTVCRNLALDRMKKAERQNASLDEQQAERPDRSRSPLELMEQRDRVETVRRLVNSLPEKQRSCMQLRDFEGKSYRDIATILGITEEQVLAKQALIYENSSPKRKPAAQTEQVRENSLREEKGSHEKKTFSAPVEEKKPEEEGKASSASFPNYLPGFEPENVKPALDRFLAVMEKEFPDKKIPGSAWNHEKWDKAAAMLCKVLGYGSGSEFLEAYGFTVMKDV